MLFYTISGCQIWEGTPNQNSDNQYSRCNSWSSLALTWRVTLVLNNMPCATPHHSAVKTLTINTLKSRPDVLFPIGLPNTTVVQMKRWQFAPSGSDGALGACSLHPVYKALVSVSTIGGMWAVVSAVGTKSSLRSGKGKPNLLYCPLTLVGGRKKKDCHKKKNAMTRAPFLFLLVIRCFPHSLPLFCLSIMLSSVVSSPVQCRRHLHGNVVQLAHKTRCRNVHAEKCTFVATTTAAAIPTSAVCSSPVSNTCMHIQLRDRKPTRTAC